MSEPRQRVQYPELQGSEQHHDLKNDPGKKGDPDHMKDDINEDDKADTDNSK